MLTETQKLKDRQDQLRDDIYGAYSTLRGSSCTDIYPGAQRDLCRSFVEVGFPPSLSYLAIFYLSQPNASIQLI